MAKKLAVVTGAKLHCTNATCSPGAVPDFISTNDADGFYYSGGESLASTSDSIVGENIFPFPGNCALGGVCKPIIIGPWTGSTSTAKDNGVSLLTEDSCNYCMKGMTKVTIADPGQNEVNVQSTESKLPSLGETLGQMWDDFKSAPHDFADWLINVLEDLVETSEAGGKESVEIGQRKNNKKNGPLERLHGILTTSYGSLIEDLSDFLDEYLESGEVWIDENIPNPNGDRRDSSEGGVVDPNKDNGNRSPGNRPDSSDDDGSNNDSTSGSTDDDSGWGGTMGI